MQMITTDVGVKEESLQPMIVPASRSTCVPMENEKINNNSNIHIYKVSEYDHKAETKQFDMLCEFMRKHVKGSAYLIGNYNIEGTELDALLITPCQVRVIEFKNGGGKIVASENGEWLSDGKVIAGGSFNKSPFEQACVNKARVTKGIKAMLGCKTCKVKVSVVFLNDSAIDSSGISDTVRQWLDIRDMGRLDELFIDGVRLFTDEEFADIPRKLNISKFLYRKNDEIRNDENVAFSQESPSSLFKELMDATLLVPEYGDVYHAFGVTYKKVLNQNTNYQRIKFGGAFAQTDYLLKENDANSFLQLIVNDARVRIKRYERGETTTQELSDNYRYDLEALCRFIALIYKIDIPGDLKALFRERGMVETKTLLTEEERFIVDSWDDRNIYGHMNNVSDKTTVVCYTEGNRNYPYDWSYVKDILYRDAQLNLVRPFEKEGVIYPELIIFEPDYLVDVTAIASCFEDYGKTPLTHLISRLQEVESTEPMLLGNFAGQLLDEEIRDSSISYKDSARRFMADNAVALLTTLVPDIHINARNQKLHIHNAFKEMTEKNIVKDFKRDDVVLEPSFICPMLGIQGRMDLLQLDFKFLIEQKSGKSEWPQPQRPSDPVKAQVKHYVQMLLYMAVIRYNFREHFECNEKKLQAFLLYSRYDNSLCGLGFAPERIFEAFKIRNLIVWCDILYSRGGYSILDNMTAETLNRENCSNILWTRYKKPQIDAVLSPIHNASELEKAYFYRMLTFISNEQMLSKIGSKMKDGSGFASTWLEDLSVKLEAGNMYDNLVLQQPTADYKGEVEQVVLGFMENRKNDMSNFRKGDIVLLYPYERGMAPDACKTMVMRCSIKDIQADTIQLMLRNPQSSNRIFTYFKDSLWAIEHDYMESSYAFRYREMHSFLSAPKQRKDLLMFCREPRVDKSIKLNGDYGDFNTLALKVKQAQDLFLIIGPPGTGKTSYGMLDTLKEELLTEGSRVLLISYTNRAVDEMCGKLIEEGIDFIRVGKKLSTSDSIVPYLLETKVGECNNIQQLQNTIDQARVIAGTTTSLSTSMPIFKRKAFTLAIVDEASQILEPDLIGIMSFVYNNDPSVGKFVFIGDHKQLPAVVQQSSQISAVDNPLLNNIGLVNCRQSLFERLLSRYRNNPDVTYMLTKQGRMHPDIAQFPNYAFYQNKLDIVPKQHQTVSLSTMGAGKNGIDDILTTRRIAFIAVPEPSKGEFVSDKVNKLEAEVIAQTVYEIYKKCRDNFKKEETVGVIVPYRNQIATIRNIIDGRFKIPELHDITIDTVERFQGSQRDYIIYGFTVQKYYQLNFLTNNTFEEDGDLIDRKLNVAMTRAREHLIMVGNPLLLNNSFIFGKLIEYVRSRQGYFEVPVSDYISGNFSVPSLIGSLDFSSTVYQCSDSFSRVFNSLVLKPIKESPLTQWPDIILGNCMSANLNRIGYGRINFSNQLSLFNGEETVALSPAQQVLLYCYYMMRTYYCCSRNIYDIHQKLINSDMASVDGRVNFIDVGCGPATAGIAFAELFFNNFKHMRYVGIDVSEDMRHMGSAMLEDMFGKSLNATMLTSFNELTAGYWHRSSESPSLFIFNMSFFFSCVTTSFTEMIARRMCEIIRLYPLNKYYVIIGHSMHDRALEPFKVFKRILSDAMMVYKDEKAKFIYQLSSEEKSLEFCYEIWLSK